jgi:hypothetical protein
METIQQAEEEVWEPIVINGKKTEYDISNMGQYRSSKYGKSIILKQSLRGNPGKKYKCGFMYLDGMRYCESIHVMVARAFIPNPDNLPEVNHRWADKFDNRAIALEWCTKLDNMRHAFSFGLIPIAKGGKHYKAKKVAKMFAGIVLKTYDCLASVKQDGYWNNLVCMAIKNKKNHKGFFWKYID